MLSARAIVPSHDVLLVTLDTLRYDAAVDALARGATPELAARIPGAAWEKRHSPGSFTYASHHAFFAGFLPTPARPGRHARLFAARFAGSETSDEHTLVFDAPDIVTGFAQRGYRTICVGGVGFFNKQNALGSVLPSLFQESHWDESLGVTAPRSTENQVSLAIDRVRSLTDGHPVFLFINVSAIHQPNRGYLPGASRDSLASHTAALAYVDRSLGVLFRFIESRDRPALVIVCSDHGTAYGEDGYEGHRLAHEVVWTVPYAEFILGSARP